MRFNRNVYLNGSHFMRAIENTYFLGRVRGIGNTVLTIIQIGIFFYLMLMGTLTLGAEFVNAPIKMEHWPPYYYPNEAVVWAGVPIQWINATASPHTVQHDACGTDKPCMFDSGKIPPTQTYTLPGLPPGRYPYHCQLHPIMGGTLIVEDPEGGDFSP